MEIKILAEAETEEFLPEGELGGGEQAAGGG
jgi:hypothetical protein